MAHGGCFGDHLEGVVSLQNQSSAYNVQASQSYRSSRAMGDRAVSMIFFPTPLSHAFGCGFFIGGLDVVNLTPKQEKFAQCVADGMSQADAYRTAYDCKPTTKPESIQDSAYKVMANPEVYQRVEELRAQLAEKSLWSRADSVNILAEIAQDLGNKAGERVSAIKELNAMHGWNNKQIIDHTSSDGSMSPAKPAKDMTKEELETELRAIGVDPSKL